MVPQPLKLQSTSRESLLGFLAMLTKKYNNNAQLANSTNQLEMRLKAEAAQVLSYYQSQLRTTLHQNYAQYQVMA